MYLKKMFAIISMILLLQLSATAQNYKSLDSTYAKPMELKLPENVKSVLLLEMTTITRLMGELLEFIVKGDSRNSSIVALEIRDTNLKQEFDSQEIREIMKILPKGFIKFDQKFHSSANELSKAVDSNDFKTAISLYTEMTQTCYSCHATYANDRFENLKSEK